eukprot:m.378103 g.378103  ORF g.378103 m.378103 type:complete len:1177 (-) comp20024_c8_seq7:50-3580(-)
MWRCSLPTVVLAAACFAAGFWVTPVAAVCSSSCPVGQGCGSTFTVGTTCETCANGFFNDAVSPPDEACTACLFECAPGTYQTATCAPEHDRSCETCSECTVYQREVAACDPAEGGQDRQCANCTFCPDGQFPTSQCDVGNDPPSCQECAVESYLAAIGDTACTPCETCDPATQYETTPCNATSNRACAPLTNCSLPTSYESTPPTTTSDRVCSPCTTTPCPANTFESAACSATDDRVCTSCTTSCPSGQGLQGTCNSTTDTSCVACETSCPAGQYLSGTCNGVDLPVCVPCTSSCSSGQYLNGTCSTNRNPTCEACTTSCGSTEYLSGTCSGSTDATCVPCDTCDPNTEFEAQSCSATSNTNCSTCTTCPATSYTASNCSATQDTVCMNCITSCPSGQTLVGSCEAFSGPLCASPSAASLDAHSMLVVSIVILCLALCAVLVLFLACPRDDEGYDDEDETGAETGMSKQSPGPVLKRRSKSFVQRLNKTRAMKLQELRVYLAHQEELNDDFMNVPLNNPLPSDVPRGVDAKNRYINILPNSETRFKLTQLGNDPTTKYINANWIPGYRQAKAWIATQGPMEETAADFWRMVWESNASIIAMVTNVREGGRQKCAKYWPEVSEPAVVYGPFVVRSLQAETHPEHVRTVIELQHTADGAVTEIVHMQYLDWPDHGAPEDTDSAIDYCLALRTERERLSVPAPLIIHCSAGIGRTGVMMGLYTAMQQIEQEGRVDLINYLGAMRKARGGCVQTEKQWLYLVQAAHDYFVQVEEFMRLYEQAQLFDRTDAIDTFLVPDNAAWDAQDILASEEQAQQAHAEELKRAAEKEARAKAAALQQKLDEEEREREEQRKRLAEEERLRREAIEEEERLRREEAAEAERRRLEEEARKAREQAARLAREEQARLERQVAEAARKRAAQERALREAIGGLHAERMVPTLCGDAANLAAGQVVRLQQQKAREARERQLRAEQERRELAEAEARRVEEERQARELAEQQRRLQEEQRRLARERAIQEQERARELAEQRRIEQQRLAEERAEAQRLALLRQAELYAEAVVAQDALVMAEQYAQEAVRMDDIEGRKASRASAAQVAGMAMPPPTAGPVGPIDRRELATAADAGVVPSTRAGKATNQAPARPRPSYAAGGGGGGREGGARVYSLRVCACGLAHLCIEISCVRE